MSTTIRPHTKPLQFLFPPLFLEKDKTFLPLLSKCSHGCMDSLLCYHLFNFSVNLLHFTSKCSTIHHRAYLPSPPTKLSLYNPSYFSLFFPIVGLQTCFTSLSFPVFPHQLFTQLSLLLIRPLPLFAGPPPVSLSGASACEASALQYALLIGSILCIITPSCLWVQLAQLGPSVWSPAR